MLLFVLRHGQAEPSSPGGDAERRLSAEGQASLRRVLQRAGISGVKPNLMLSSPYIRARQTAEIAREVLQFSGQILSSSALVPESSVESVWDEVRAHSGALKTSFHADQDAQLMLVGHNPLLSDLLMRTLDAAGHAIDLRPAGLACVNVGSIRSQPKGRLLWLLTPEISA